MEFSLGPGDETVEVGMNVTCKDCGAIQMFLEGQQKCSCCGKHMSNWSTKAQYDLKLKKAKNNDHVEDGVR